jgi:hypothetical protein
MIEACIVFAPSLFGLQMTCNGRLVSFLNLHCFEKGEFHINEIGNDENETEVSRGSGEWLS